MSKHAPYRDTSRQEASRWQETLPRYNLLLNLGNKYTCATSHSSVSKLACWGRQMAGAVLCIFRRQTDMDTIVQHQGVFPGVFSSLSHKQIESTMLAYVCSLRVICMLFRSRVGLSPTLAFSRSPAPSPRARRHAHQTMLHKILSARCPLPVHSMGGLAHIHFVIAAVHYLRNLIFCILLAVMSASTLPP